MAKVCDAFVRDRRGAGEGKKGRPSASNNWLNASARPWVGHVKINQYIKAAGRPVALSHARVCATH